MKTITLSDVAAVAHVDLSTASRVLRGEGRVSTETRRRILDAAERLDYRPNAQAQFLARGISKTVGVLTMNAPGVFAMPVLTGVTTTLGQLDIATLLYDARTDSGLLRESVRKFHARRIDGLLVLGAGLMRTPIHSISSGFDVPVAYAYATSDDPADAWFMPDGEQAGRLAAKHLIDIGRRRIAHITSKDDIGARDRAAGFRATLATAGLEMVSAAPLEGDWTRLWGGEATRRLLDQGVDFDAIFCGNDQIALGAYGVLRAAGVSVPDDVALVGVDNWEGLVGNGDPLLTTVDPNLLGVGKSAARFLTAATEGDYTPGAHYEPASLVLGETTMGSGYRTTSDPEGRI
ncbi:LacI family transcriptional regulator [Frondihabitans sucicola]|uniref:LacI family transcriptional regulator n=1 Tax=Frondihabitans sucicola TaxID=1268041 RepID=A0ABN6XXB9_9MICO|nr:LacI family DNA-binding transcriptional regulator [Frondihabitans sucicola]BDZ49401.1 LacI family transcriptional regulator [Frondihabitans sucicola]